MQKPEKHIFVCSRSRPNGQQKGFCHAKEGVEIMSMVYFHNNSGYTPFSK